MRHDDAVPLDPTPRAPESLTGPAARALLTVTGEDRPGVTARLFARAGRGGRPVEVLDVEQVVVHGHLVLGVVVGSLAADGPAADDAALLARMTGVAEAVAADTGMRVQVESATEPAPGGPVPAGAAAPRDRARPPRAAGRRRRRRPGRRRRRAATSTRSAGSRTTR